MTNIDRDKLIKETHDVVTSLSSDMRLLVSHVKDLRLTVYGNGTLGLKERLRMVEMRQDDCPARESALGTAKRNNRMFLVALCALLVTAASLVFAFLKP